MFSVISEPFGRALQDCVRHDRARTWGSGQARMNYPVLFGGSGLSWVVLLDDVNAATTAQGNPCPWNATDQRYEPDTTTTYTVSDPTGGRWYGLKGQWVLCRSGKLTGTSYPNWEIVWAANRFEFELSGDLTPALSGGVAAYPLNTSGAADTTRSTITIYDAPEGNRRALGKTTAGTGARGKAWWNPDRTSPQWEIETIFNLAKMIQVATPSNVAAGATFELTSCTVLDDGQNPCSNANSITVTNWNQQLCSGVTATCIQNGSGFLVIDADCPPSGGCST